MTQSALIKKNKSIISFLRTVLCLGLAVVMILLSDILKSEIYGGFIFSFTTVKNYAIIFTARKRAAHRPVPGKAAGSPPSPPARY